MLCNTCNHMPQFDALTFFFTYFTIGNLSIFESVFPPIFKSSNRAWRQIKGLYKFYLNHHSFILLFHQNNLHSPSPITFPLLALHLITLIILITLFLFIFLPSSLCFSSTDPIFSSSVAHLQSASGHFLSIFWSDPHLLLPWCHLLLSLFSSHHAYIMRPPPSF